MAYFGHFYLDREKDIIVELYRDGGEMRYVLRTPNHHSGNLITNFAALCGAELETEESTGLKIMTGPVFSYIDGNNRQVYIMRLGGTKVANIYPDGLIERKATVPAIAKTFMSQTKHYRLDLFRTLVKTYIFSECKFKTDLHTHMNAILEPDILIALGLAHQINYPLYYIKKLGLKLSARQKSMLERARSKAEKSLDLNGLSGKYRDRRIDDNCFINFADLILKNPSHAAENLAAVRNSLAILKDGQAVFSNLEKVYLYRYVFTKGIPCGRPMDLEVLNELGKAIPDSDIKGYFDQMIRDKKDVRYRENSLFQDKLLWIGRSYAGQGITYAEISDTALAREESAPGRLAEIHKIMPEITRETGVLLRFLAGIRRTPLTIVKANVTPADYLKENLRVLEAVAADPYVAGCDILGEEINDIRELAPLIGALAALAEEVPGFVIRIHAGESDSLRDNVEAALFCVKDALKPGQPMPHLRIGHGLYTTNLQTPHGRRLLEEIRAAGAVLEFQLSSNVRLNNLSRMERHPLKQYLSAGVLCVQGTDGGALYGTNPIDEQLALERMLGLSREDQLKMRQAEDRVLTASLKAFDEKKKAPGLPAPGEISSFYAERIRARQETPLSLWSDKRIAAESALSEQIRRLPADKMPLIVAGGSFNGSRHKTVMRDEELKLLDELLERADPEKVFFVIGHQLSGYERYITEHNTKGFEIFAIVPTLLTPREAAAVRKAELGVRLSIEPYGLGLYKSFAYEIFKRRRSVLLALDGNAAGANLIQEAKNGKKKARIFVSSRSRTLRAKTQTLGGYATLFLKKDEVAGEILSLLD